MNGICMNIVNTNPVVLGQGLEASLGGTVFVNKVMSKKRMQYKVFDPSQVSLVAGMLENISSKLSVQMMRTPVVRNHL